MYGLLGPIDQNARSVIHPVQRAAKGQRCVGSRIECRQLAFAALPSLPIGLHDGGRRAGVQAPGQRLALPCGPFSGVSPSFGIGRPAMPLRSIQCCMARAFAQVGKRNTRNSASSRHSASTMNSSAAAMRLLEYLQAMKN
jgi:hypothetical protein